MKRYNIQWTPDGSVECEQERGIFVKYEDVNEMHAALVFITEYWNGNPDSAVDAIEEAIATAKEALWIVDGEGN